jgi:hypothetical protein
MWIDAPLPDAGSQPAGTYDPASLFWQHECLHRATLRDYPTRIQRYKTERDDLEREFVAGALDCASHPVEARAAYAADCYTRAVESERRWLESVSRLPLQTRANWLYSSAWNGFNRQANIEVA